jgi:hypothetical protein
MKTETLIWFGVTMYFLVIAVAYLVVGGEAVGVTILLGAAALGGLIAGWSWGWRRRNGARPEDREEADAADETGLVGIYPTESLRPVALAVGATALLAGVPLGSWMSMAGLAIIASQVLLLVRDLDS